MNTNLIFTTHLLFDCDISSCPSGQVICWDRGRPARKRANGAQSFASGSQTIFALGAHWRAGRPPSQQNNLKVPANHFRGPANHLNGPAKHVNNLTDVHEPGAGVVVTS